MKNILLVLMSLFLFSCNDFFTLQPENKINEQTFYKNQDDFETYLTGIYGGLQYLQNYIFINEVGTDNAVIQLSNAASSETDFEYMNISPTNDYVSGYWTNAYTTIGRVNTMFSYIDKVDFDETSKNSIKGESEFLRALSYFNLVRLYGPVYLVKDAFTSPNQIENYDLTRKPVNDIYDFIISDLTDAEKLLPTTIPSNKGKISIGAVKTLLAEVYLTMHNYDLAAQKLKEVIDMNAYSLVDDYTKLFTEGNDDTKESIFEIEYASGNVGEGSSFGFHYYPNVINMAVFTQNQVAGGRCVPSETLFDGFESGDLRKAMYGDQLPMSDGTTSHWLYCKKFVDYNAPSPEDEGVNYLYMRYADVLLMYAETLNELGRTSEAFAYINMVRNRAGLKDLSNLSQSDLRFAIEKERQYELAFECHRWFDLLRTGRTITVLNADYQKRGLTFSVDQNELLLPIPQSQLDINPKLTQNDGY